MNICINERVLALPISDHISGRRLGEGSTLLMNTDDRSFVLVTRNRNSSDRIVVYPDNIVRIDDDCIRVNMNAAVKRPVSEPHYVKLIGASARICEGVPEMMLSSVLVDTDTYQIVNISFGFRSKTEPKPKPVTSERAETPAFAGAASSHDHAGSAANEDTLRRIDELNERFDNLEFLLGRMIEEQRSNSSERPFVETVQDRNPENDAIPTASAEGKTEPEPEEEIHEEIAVEEAAEYVKKWIPHSLPKQYFEPVPPDFVKIYVRSGASAAKSPIDVFDPFEDDEPDVPQTTALIAAASPNDSRRKTRVVRGGTAFRSVLSQILGFLLFTGVYMAMSYVGII